jgi:pyruvate/2-oxoacid:ferredoxin oxidoreductase alpha subunit
MTIDKNKIITQDEIDEPAPMEQAEERVEKEMKELEEKTKRDVAEGLKKQGDPDAED